MVGKVITEPLDKDKIDAGAIAVINGKLEGEQFYDVCTVTRLDPAGNWVVVGKQFAGPLLPGMELCTLMIEGISGTKFPLKFNQWPMSIEGGEVNTDKKVTFTVVSAKFVDGHYMNRCIDCSLSFMGHKRQPFCKDCCDKMLTAKILISKEDFTALSPEVRKRPRLLTPDKAMDIARKAWRRGLEGELSPKFENWLRKQF